MRFLCWLVLGLVAAAVTAVQAQAQGAAPPGEKGRVLVERTVLPHDVLKIEVFGEEDMTAERKVTEDGSVTYWLLERPIPVRGKTPSEVERYLTEALGRDYLVNPQVSVSIKEYVEHTVNVTGAVNKPDQYPLPTGQRWRIVDAISKAGGLTPKAKKEIRFIRRGQPQVLRYDKLQQETDPEKIIWLEPGDLIIVEESFF